MHWSDITRHFFFKVFPLVFCGLSFLFGLWKYLEPPKSLEIVQQENASEKYLLAKNVTQLMRRYPDSIPLHVAYYSTIQNLDKQDFMVFRQWEAKNFGPNELWVTAIKRDENPRYKDAGYFNDLLRTYFSGELKDFPINRFEGEDRHDAIALATFYHLKRQNNLSNMMLAKERERFPNNPLVSSFPFFTKENSNSKILGISAYVVTLRFWLTLLVLLVMGASLIRFVFELDVFRVQNRGLLYKGIAGSVIIFSLLGVLMHYLMQEESVHWFWVFTAFELTQHLFLYSWKKGLPISKSLWNEVSFRSILSVIVAVIFLASVAPIAQVIQPLLLLGFVVFKMALSIFPVYWWKYERKYPVPRVLLEIAGTLLPAFYYFIWLKIDNIIPHIFLLYAGLLFISGWVIMMNNILNRHPKFRVQYDAPTNYYKRIWYSMLGVWVVSQGLMLSVSVGAYMDFNLFLGNMAYAIPFYFLMVNTLTRWELNKNRKIPFQLLRLEYHYDFREMKDKRLILLPTHKGITTKEPPIVGKVVNRILIGKNTEWLHVELYWPLSFEKKFYNHIAVKLAHPGHTYRRKNAVLAIRLLSFEPSQHQYAIPIDKTKSYGSGLLKALK